KAFAWRTDVLCPEGQGCFHLFSNNHHEDGHLAVWLPAPPGLQAALIEDAPATYFKPPYVGVSGWIGIELDQIQDDALEIHIHKAWELAGGKKKNSGNSRKSSGGSVLSNRL